MKHAYLIIVHHEFDVLQRLVSVLDDKRNDIYIHFDKKIEDLPVVETKKANLLILKKRIDVRWGDVSQIEAEYRLFESSFEGGPYSYYHLLSGVDMPLKSQDEIHTFFDRHQGKEFIGFDQQIDSKEIDRKVRRYHLFPRFFRSETGLLDVIRRMIRFVALRLQCIFGIKRHTSIDFKKGTSWISVTHDFIGFLLPKFEEVKKMYTNSFCADEIFLHTLCWNSSFRANLYDAGNETRGSMRLINWNNNRLVEWKDEDYDILMQSNAMFARKFSYKHFEIVERVISQINKT